jgi:dTDP-glucose pyrophosphorylase
MISDFKQCYVSEDTTLHEALSVINSTEYLIALAVDMDHRLIGTLTDGDVRRALLHGETLLSPVSSAMNRDFRYLSNGVNNSHALAMMNLHQLKQLPVLDDRLRVVSLIMSSEKEQEPKLPNAAVIMAGGKGLRLRPHTDNCPKPMLLVEGKPILQSLIERSITHGFSKFYISVNYLKEQIIEYFSDGSKWNISIDYLIEDEPLGTAGSLQLLPETLGEPFLLMNGDLLTLLNPRQLLDFHTMHKSIATMCVREYVSQCPYGVVQTNGIELITFDEKPSFTHFVNAGIYILDPKILSYLEPNTPMDMPTLLLNAQKNDQRVSVCPIHEYWIDVGMPETLNRAHQEWSIQSNL